MKTNKEIIKELKKIKIDHTDSDNDGFNRLCSTEISKIMNIFTQALEQKEREVRERLGLNKKCLIYADNHNFILRKCVDCGLIISEEQEKNIILKSKTT